MPEKFQWHVLEDFTKRHGYKNGAELGVRWGQTSRYLLNNIPDLHIIGVDLMRPNPEANEAMGEETYVNWDWADNERQVQEIERKFPDRFLMMRMDTTEAAKEIPDGSLDWIFIDADHSFLGVSTDIRNWRKKVKKGGVIVGHDINLNTVRKAVTMAFDSWHTQEGRWNNCWWSYV